MIRRSGSSSPPSRRGHSHQVDLRVDAIRRIAHDGEREISDVVRDAI